MREDNFPNPMNDPFRGWERWWARWVVLNLVGGGFTGAALTVQAMMAEKGPSGFVLFLYGLAAAIYVAFAIVGLRKAENPRPSALLICCFLLQTPVLFSPLVTYQCVAGTSAVVALVNGEIVWGFRLGAHWEFNLLRPGNYGLGLNLAALVAVLVEGRRYLRLLDARDDARAGQSPVEAMGGRDGNATEAASAGGAQ